MSAARISRTNEATKSSQMGPEITLALLSAGVTLSGAMIWLERRPRKNLDVRLFPTTPFLLLGILTIIASSIHLLGMLGHQ